jgi:hypothetical protein
MVINKKMRHAFVLLAFALVMISLFACGKTPPRPPEIPNYFQSNLVIRVEEHTFKASLMYRCAGYLSVQFLEPVELKDFTMELEDEHLRLKCGELSAGWSTDVLPETGFLPLLNEVFFLLSQPATRAVPQKQGGWRIEGISRGNAYMAYLNDDGMLVKLGMPSVGLEIELS